jgi:hypothetical protein
MQVVVLVLAHAHGCDNSARALVSLHFDLFPLKYIFFFEIQSIDSAGVCRRAVNFLIFLRVLHWKIQNSGIGIV